MRRDADFSFPASEQLTKIPDLKLYVFVLDRLHIEPDGCEQNSNVSGQTMGLVFTFTLFSASRTCPSVTFLASSMERNSVRQRFDL